MAHISIAIPIVNEPCIKQPIASTILSNQRITQSDNFMVTIRSCILRLTHNLAEETLSPKKLLVAYYLSLF